MANMSLGGVSWKIVLAGNFKEPAEHGIVVGANRHDKYESLEGLILETARFVPTPMLRSKINNSSRKSNTSAVVYVSVNGEKLHHICHLDESQKDTEVGIRNCSFRKNDKVRFRVLFRSTGGTIRLTGRYIYTSNLPKYLEETQNPIIKLKKLQVKLIDVRKKNRNLQLLKQSLTNRSYLDNYEKPLEYKQTANEMPQKLSQKKIVELANVAEDFLFKRKKEPPNSLRVSAFRFDKSSILEDKGDSRHSNGKTKYYTSNDASDAYMVDSLNPTRLSISECEDIPLIKFKQHSDRQIQCNKNKIGEPIDELSSLMETSMVLRKKHALEEKDYTKVENINSPICSNISDTHAGKCTLTSHKEKSVKKLDSVLLESNETNLLDAKTMPNFASFTRKCKETIQELQVLDNSINNLSIGLLEGTKPRIELLEDRINEKENTREETLEWNPIRKSPKRSSPARKHHPYGRFNSNLDSKQKSKNIGNGKVLRFDLDFKDSNIGSRVDTSFASTEETKQTSKFISSLKSLFYFMLKSLTYILMFFFGLVFFSIYDPAGFDNLFDATLNLIDKFDSEYDVT